MKKRKILRFLLKIEHREIHARVAFDILGTLLPLSPHNEMIKS